MIGDKHLENETEKADQFNYNLFLFMMRLDSALSATPSIAPAVSIPATGIQIRLSKWPMEVDLEITKRTPFRDSYNLAIHKNSIKAECMRANKFN